MAFPSIHFGGPAYEMRVDARNRASASCLAFIAGREGGSDWLDLAKHNTPVAVARNHLFERVLESGVEVSVWLDADNYLDPSLVPELAKLIQESCMMHRPYVALPSRKRDGEWNFVMREGEGFATELPKHATSAYVVGGAGAIYWLPWFRDHWPKPPWFMDHWQCEGSKVSYISEDFTFCHLFRELGGTPMVAPIPLRHAHRGGEGI